MHRTLRKSRSTDDGIVKLQLIRCLVIHGPRPFGRVNAFSQCPIQSLSDGMSDPTTLGEEIALQVPRKEDNALRGIANRPGIRTPDTFVEWLKAKHEREIGWIALPNLRIRKQNHPIVLRDNAGSLTSHGEQIFNSRQSPRPRRRRPSITPS